MWVFRRKRTPDGKIKKYKGRFIVRGDLQEKTADHDEDSYAPVAQWSSICVMLVISLILGWSTCSIDFANAFVQAYRNPFGFTYHAVLCLLRLMTDLRHAYV